MCAQRGGIGVTGQCDNSSGVPAMGGSRPELPGEGGQGSGSGLSSDRLVPESTITHIFIVVMMLICGIISHIEKLH